MPDSTDDESCWDLFQKWLQQCQMNHELCRLRSHPRSWYPTRLLRISDWPIKDPWTRMIRLHITAEEEMAGPYMTVSHCWGGEVPTTLTEETMDFLKAGLVMQDLPKTFTDAVRIVASCGVEYLWIDSLCIIQGSEEDWRREASMMGKVYSNSFCNIAATGSPNSSGGFFHPRDPMDVQSIEVKATWACETADTYEDYSESPPPGDYICFDTNYWIRGLDNSPLGNAPGPFRSAIWRLDRYISARSRSSGNVASMRPVRLSQVVPHFGDILCLLRHLLLTPRPS
jgi:Heterokaryon incompatibility protein (HET)